jgi:CheY-like chemotaxis protein
MSTPRILIVEDNPADIALLMEALEGRDITVESHHDPKDALGSLVSGASTRPVDLVVLDYNMPGMTGLEWLSKVRSYPRFSELPIVVWSSSSSPREAEKLRALQASIHRKPATYQEVLEFSSYLALKIEKLRAVGARSATGAR